MNKNFYLIMQTIPLHEIYIKLRVKEDIINYFREHRHRKFKYSLIKGYIIQIIVVIIINFFGYSRR